MYITKNILRNINNSLGFEVKNLIAVILLSISSLATADMQVQQNTVQLHTYQPNYKKPRQHQYYYPQQEHYYYQPQQQQVQVQQQVPLPSIQNGRLVYQQPYQQQGLPSIQNGRLVYPQ